MSTASVVKNKGVSQGQSPARTLVRAVLFPFWVVLWPIAKAAKALDHNFLSYMTSRVLRDQDRVYSIRFVWYGDSIYLHPMIWGSLILYALAGSGIVSPGWLLLAWFVGLAVCFMTIIYNFDIVKVAVLGTALIAVFGVAYFSTMELAWNPLTEIARHVSALDAAVSPGFYVASAYLFAMLIVSEVIWAWLFHRVEIDESYVYEHQFLRGTAREPIFAQGLKRETKDLLEMLILGAADIQHRTKKGAKRFKNVPLASLGLGKAIDALLDHKRKGQILLERKEQDNSDQVRIQDAVQEELDDWDDADDENDDGGPAETVAIGDAADDADMS